MHIAIKGKFVWKDAENFNKDVNVKIKNIKYCEIVSAKQTNNIISKYSAKWRLMLQANLMLYLCST